MKPKIKELWIKALESGDYIKGKVFLRKQISNEGLCSYCALGVLTDLYVKQDDNHQWIESVAVPSKSITYTIAGAFRCEASSEVMNWAGIDDDYWARFTDENGDDTSIAEISDCSVGWVPVIDSIRKHF